MNGTSRPEAARTQLAQEDTRLGGVGSPKSLRIGQRGDGRGDAQSPAGCRARATTAHAECRI
jgi:hypothetical protein